MALIPVTRAIAIDEREIGESFTRASGPGGQHVNTTDSAVLLRFDVMGSPSLPEAVKMRLAVLAGARLSRDGVLTLRADASRSQEMNRREVRERLIGLIRRRRWCPRSGARPSRPRLPRPAASMPRRAAAPSRRGAARFASTDIALGRPDSE